MMRAAKTCVIPKQKGGIMGIRRWKDHKGRERIYVSRKWPDRTRFRRLMPNLTVAKKTLARIEESIAMTTWRDLRKELCGCERAELKIAELIEIYLSEYC